MNREARTTIKSNSDVIKMESLLYNINVQVYNGIVCIPESVTGIENIPASFEYLSPRVRAKVRIVKLHGVERALCRCGKSQELKYRIVAAIRQQQQVCRVGGC